MHIKGGLRGHRGNPLDKSDEGVFISKINSGGAAKRDARLKVVLLKLLKILKQHRDLGVLEKRGVKLNINNIWFTVRLVWGYWRLMAYPYLEHPIKKLWMPFAVQDKKFILLFAKVFFFFFWSHLVNSFRIFSAIVFELWQGMIRLKWTGCYPRVNSLKKTSLYRTVSQVWTGRMKNLKRYDR